MIKGLFGAGTMPGTLRGGLAEANATHRTIATRVANAIERSATTGFGDQLDAATAALQQEELQRDMASLADTQLRYEATAKLLQKSYADLRTAIRDRG